MNNKNFGPQVPVFSLDDLFGEARKLPPYEEYVRWTEMRDRILVINDAIDDLSTETIIMPILKWNKEDEGIPEEERKPISLYLNTPGGDVLTGLIIAEVINKSVTPIDIVVLAKAASMGAIILASGKRGRRYAYEFSNVLIHDGDLGLRGSSNKVRDNIKFYGEKDEQIKNLIIKNTLITLEKYDEMKDREWWMTAQAALEYGIIDHIIGGGER